MSCFVPLVSLSPSDISSIDIQVFDWSATTNPLFSLVNPEYPASLLSPAGLIYIFVSM